MKVRIIKFKKNYTIEIIKNNKIINQYQTNKIEQFQLNDVILKKCKSIELSNSLMLMYKSTYPKINKFKIFKMHLKKFNECFDGKYNKEMIIKKIIKEMDNKFVACFYFINSEIFEFLSNNKLLNCKILFLDHKKIFNRHYQNLLLINQYEISLWNEELLKYHIQFNLKNIINNVNLISSLLFTNIKLKHLNLVINKEKVDELTLFLNTLKARLEDKVRINIETI